MDGFSTPFGENFTDDTARRCPAQVCAVSYRGEVLGGEEVLALTSVLRLRLGLGLGLSLGPGLGLELVETELAPGLVLMLALLGIELEMLAAATQSFFAGGS